MGKTIAQALQEEAGVNALRKALIRLLRKRFGEVPAEGVQKVEATEDTDQLYEWLERVVTATVKKISTRCCRIRSFNPLFIGARLQTRS